MKVKCTSYMVNKNKSKYNDTPKEKKTYLSIPTYLRIK